MDKGTGQTKEEEVEAARKRVAERQSALFELFFKQARDTSDGDVEVTFDAISVGRSVRELLDVRQEYFFMWYSLLNETLQSMESLEPDGLQQFTESHRVELLKATLADERENCSIYVIDNFLINLLSRLTFDLVKSSKDTERMKETWVDLLPTFKKFQALIEERGQQDDDAVKERPKSSWTDLIKRHFVS